MAIGVEREKHDGPGRPKFVLSEEVLLYFRDLGYCWQEIATMLCVSRWTVSRRVAELGLKNITGYTNINKEELERVIIEIKRSHGAFLGRSMVIGLLKSRGIRVQQRRVTEILHKIDPENSRIRWAALIRRRKYSVPGPNSLWHIDGHHSLITWKFVIHGAIDGHSRLITYLNCSTNNRKETVLDLFNAAICELGIPSRVRSDKGGENVLVWEKMTQLRGEGRGSFLAGSSVHNQRIERLWRDVWTYVTYQFYYTFQAMEDQGILNMENDVHVFVLHRIFQPRINRVITSFISGWNNHPLRTERNWSPRKIWNNGMRNMELNEGGPVEDLVWFGIDWTALSPLDNGLPTVELEDVRCPHSQNIEEAINVVDIMRDSCYFGIDIFLEVLSYIEGST
ncbi:uncharacterized protein LOC130636097 [Hydractinia symbiolongicarpus]|uniref:uncharacterized protein LOC130636097 n=1 Tax=Hydractinia symbiolongicarpus TaxID=13093 RepID=UPI00254C79D3|nr:uncharacterized protein LOC130636097 [Hydractinia symbiolongicarpus]